jgi:hypothetical protein
MRCRRVRVKQEDERESAANSPHGSYPDALAQAGDPVGSERSTMPLPRDPPMGRMIAAAFLRRGALEGVGVWLGTAYVTTPVIFLIMWVGMLVVG